MVLATKYRPKTFEEVLGRNTTVNILKEEIDGHELKHAYLFMGQAGSGKTTISRILANSINAYTIELDMASHGSAEDMRSLIETVKTKPMGYDYYVVILDEVQASMSRKDSMSAQVLLKTLEEPPSHVIFILCTTEGDKIIDTIKSRCEIFSFNPIHTDFIIERLKYICDKENIKYEDNAIKRIACLAKGNMRQAITYLDTLNYRADITMQSVNDYFGIGEYDSYFNLLYAVCDKDIENIVKYTKNINEAYINDFFSFILDVSIYNNTHNEKLVDIPSSFTEDIDNLSKADKDTVDKLRNELLNLIFEGKNSPIIRNLFVATILKLIEG